MSDFSALLAALTWAVGVPVVMLALWASYLGVGVFCAMLGLTLIPVVTDLRHASSRRLTLAIRMSGVALSVTLALSGIALTLGAAGRLGEHALEWLPGPSFIVMILLFVWIGLASYALRGSSARGRTLCWLGQLTATAFLAPVLASLLFSVSGIVYTNVTILPFLLLGLLSWVSLPVWLAAVVTQRTATARPS